MTIYPEPIKTPHSNHVTLFPLGNKTFFLEAEAGGRFFNPANVYMFTISVGLTPYFNAFLLNWKNFSIVFFIILYCVQKF